MRRGQLIEIEDQSWCPADLHLNLAAFDTPDELRELAKSVDGATGYDWTAGHAGGGPIAMTYLVGTPVRQQGTAR